MNLLANISFLFYSQDYGPATRFSPRKRKSVDLKENDETNSDENVLDSSDEMSENDELEGAQDDTMHEKIDIEKAV